MLAADAEWQGTRTGGGGVEGVRSTWKGQDDTKNTEKTKPNVITQEIIREYPRSAARGPNKTNPNV